MNQVSNYQGVRMDHTQEEGLRTIHHPGHVIHYPGVRSKGSSTKVVRKVSSEGKVQSLFSWTANISEETLAKEIQMKNNILRT